MDIVFEAVRCMDVYEEYMVRIDGFMQSSVHGVDVERQKYYCSHILDFGKKMLESEKERKKKGRREETMREVVQFLCGKDNSKRGVDQMVRKCLTAWSCLFKLEGVWMYYCERLKGKYRKMMSESRNGGDGIEKEIMLRKVEGFKRLKQLEIEGNEWKSITETNYFKVIMMRTLGEGTVCEKELKKIIDEIDTRLLVTDDIFETEDHWVLNEYCKENDMYTKSLEFILLEEFLHMNKTTYSNGVLSYIFDTCVLIYVYKNDMEDIIEHRGGSEEGRMKMMSQRILDEAENSLQVGMIKDYKELMYVENNTGPKSFQIYRFFFSGNSSINFILSDIPFVEEKSPNMMNLVYSIYSPEKVNPIWCLGRKYLPLSLKFTRRLKLDAQVYPNVREEDRFVIDIPFTHMIDQVQHHIPSYVDISSSCYLNIIMFEYEGGVRICTDMSRSVSLLLMLKVSYVQLVTVQPVQFYQTSSMKVVYIVNKQKVSSHTGSNNKYWMLYLGDDISTVRDLIKFITLDDNIDVNSIVERIKFAKNDLGRFSMSTGIGNESSKVTEIYNSILSNRKIQAQSNMEDASILDLKLINIKAHLLNIQDPQLTSGTGIPTTTPLDIYDDSIDMICTIELGLQDPDIHSDATLHKPISLDPVPIKVSLSHIMDYVIKTHNSYHPGEERYEVESNGSRYCIVSVKKWIDYIDILSDLHTVLSKSDSSELEDEEEFIITSNNSKYKVLSMIYNRQASVDGTLVEDSRCLVLKKVSLAGLHREARNDEALNSICLQECKRRSILYDDLPLHDIYNDVYVSYVLVYRSFYNLGDAGAKSVKGNQDHASNQKTGNELTISMERFYKEYSSYVTHIVYESYDDEV